MTEAEEIKFIEWSARLAEDLERMGRAVHEMSDIFYRNERFREEWRYFIYELIDRPDENEEDDKPCFVYYILNQEKDKVKIGVSNNPISRAKQLQNACGEEIEILHVIEFKNREEALKAEAFLHMKFSDFRKKPTKVSRSCEWFDATICERLMTHYGTAEQIEATKQVHDERMRQAMENIKIFV